MNLKPILDAIERGNALPNSAPWKIAGIAAMALVGFVNLYYPVPVTLDQVVTLIGVVFAIYTQIATTEKLGISKRTPPRD